MSEQAIDMERAEAITDARREFTAALDALNRAGSKLNALGIEPNVGGWTTPGNWGYVRCQGNMSASYEEMRRV